MITSQKMNSFLFPNTHNQVFVFNSFFLSFSHFHFICIHFFKSPSKSRRIVSVEKDGFEIILIYSFIFAFSSDHPTSSTNQPLQKKRGRGLSEWLKLGAGSLHPPTRNCHHQRRDRCKIIAFSTCHRTHKEEVKRVYVCARLGIEPFLNKLLPASLLDQTSSSDSDFDSSIYTSPLGFLGFLVLVVVFLVHLGFCCSPENVLCQSQQSRCC